MHVGNGAMEVDRHRRLVRFLLKRLPKQGGKGLVVDDNASRIVELDVFRADAEVAHQLTAVVVDRGATAVDFQSERADLIVCRLDGRSQVVCKDSSRQHNSALVIELNIGQIDIDLLRTVLNHLFSSVTRSSVWAWAA